MFNNPLFALNITWINGRQKKSNGNTGTGDGA